MRFIVNHKDILSVLTRFPQSTNSIAKQLNCGDSSIMLKMRNIDFKRHSNIIEERGLITNRYNITFRICDSFTTVFEEYKTDEDKITFLEQNPQSLAELYMEGKLILTTDFTI